MSEVSGFPMPQLDPRVLEVYRGVREVRDILGYTDSGWALTHGPCQINYGDRGQDWGRAGRIRFLHCLPLPDPGSPLNAGHLENESFGIVLEMSERQARTSSTMGDFASLVPRCYVNTAVGNCPRLLRSSLPCPTGSRSSMSRSPRPGLQLPCIKPPGSMDGSAWQGVGYAGSACWSR